MKRIKPYYRNCAAIVATFLAMFTAANPAPAATAAGAGIKVSGEQVAGYAVTWNGESREKLVRQLTTYHLTLERDFQIPFDPNNPRQADLEGDIELITKIAGDRQLMATANKLRLVERDGHWFVEATSLEQALNPEPEEADEIDTLRAKAERGDAEAALVLGMRYRDARGVGRDYAEAVKWYRLAADLGSGAGMDNVGFMYLQGWGLPQDEGIAAAYFAAGGKAGDPQALYNLGECYFSGRGVEQDYGNALQAWERATQIGHDNSAWRLAMMFAAGESVPVDHDRAMRLCREIAENRHDKAMLLLGELAATSSDRAAAREWWEKAAGLGNRQGDALLRIAKWRWLEPIAGERRFVDVGHLYQGWNNCGATSVAMFTRHVGKGETPYELKRLCPRSPVGTGTDWADLVAAVKGIGVDVELVTFANDEPGFEEGTAFIRARLDKGEPVVIDFTVERKSGGKSERFGHTLLVVGYNTERDQFVLKNPNQPSPGIELMTASELKRNWYSRGYSASSGGKTARPLIVSGDSRD